MYSSNGENLVVFLFLLSCNCLVSLPRAKRVAPIASFRSRKGKTMEVLECQTSTEAHQCLEQGRKILKRENTVLHSVPSFTETSMFSIGPRVESSRVSGISGKEPLQVQRDLHEDQDGQSVHHSNNQVRDAVAQPGKATMPAQNGMIVSPT